MCYKYVPYIYYGVAQCIITGLSVLTVTDILMTVILKTDGWYMHCIG